MEKEKYLYQKEWEEYRKRQKFFWLSTLIIFPLIFFSGVFFNEFFKVEITGGLDIGSLYFIAFAIIVGISSFRFQLWKCPRCGNAFHWAWWWSSVFARKCLHCKLPKYTGSTFKV
jgi:hypothetical protein